jgi:UDP-N-acetylglucosamine--N-acetylmuramyl-(pentapeptide) pyrophosphoryl-undecaprenol N-acetylglucosamine transferase
MADENKNIPMSKNRSEQVRVLIAAGGTGGHVYPAIAIADELKAICSEIAIKFAGTKNRMEWKAVPKAGYDIVSIWISGFQRQFTLKNLLFPVKLTVSLVQSRMILSSFKPDLVISCGGFAAGPIGWIAARKKMPLFIQEQNSFPGITNRLLAKHARTIFTAFKEADRHFPADKTVLAGNPTRKTLANVDTAKSYEFFSFTRAKNTLLILGGRGGARRINEAVAHNMNELHHKLELQVIWQCGERYYEELRHDFDEAKFNKLRLVDFLDQMPKAYAIADVVVSRSGALTCSELAITGNAGILVPSPNVAGNHQMNNARSMVDEGAALLLENDDAKESLVPLVEKLMKNEKERKTMQQKALKMSRPNAASEIATEIMKAVNPRGL